MSKMAKQIVENAADVAISQQPVNKMFGGGAPDKKALVKAWLPFAVRLEKATNGLEKTVNKLEKSVKDNAVTSEYISGVNEKMLAVDSRLLASVERMANPTDDDVNVRVQGIIQRNMRGGAHPFVLIPPNVINLN
jgi:uncharacterized alkaline shock family protein YloU